jgi:hypothetical protein
MKRIPGILLLFLIALIAGCATADSERWKLRPVFDVKFTDDQGRERAFTFRGVEGKIGMPDAPLYVDVPQKIVWHSHSEPRSQCGAAFQSQADRFRNVEARYLYRRSPL